MSPSPIFLETFPIYMRIIDKYKSTSVVTDIFSKNND